MVIYRVPTSESSQLAPDGGTVDHGWPLTEIAGFISLHIEYISLPSPQTRFTLDGTDQFAVSTSVGFTHG
ncbi:MAG: hypothetical protein J07HQX50_01574 [Haloquadratum sp. J07HQX50]|nr:MAG: hypothetical protein J07HQX50_01574 [Haloquadratum sp. J07HQX50]